MDNKEYFAFISYQRKDEEWAKWLAHELEHYRFPVTLNGRSDLPKELRPIFRDIDELSAGNLPIQIHNALENSKHLIVICSPNSAKSQWVNKEIEEFVSMGKVDKIFPFIIDGKAFSEDDSKECFPPALRNLPKEDERLGGNINEMGRDAAVVKTVAGMLDLAFDTLWQRYEREKAEEERKIREQRDNLLRVQSRFLSEKAISLVEENDSYTGRLLALAALPNNIDSPERPYVAEAEYALRHANHSNSAILHLKNPAQGIFPLIINANNDLLATCDAYCFEGYIKIWNFKDGTLNRAIPVRDLSIPLAFSNDNKKIYLGRNDMILQLDIVSGQISIIKEEQGDVFLSFKEDIKIYISVNTEEKEFRIWNLESNNILCKFTWDEFDDIQYWKSDIPIFFNKEGNLIACTLGYSTYIWDIKRTNCLFKFVNEYEDGFYPVLSAAFSPDGQYIAIGDQAGNIRLWDILTGTLRNTLVGHKYYVTSVTFNSDGTKIISASRDCTIRIWDVKSSKLERILNGHNHAIEHIVYNSTNNSLLSISQDKTIRIWDIENKDYSIRIIDNYKLNWIQDHSICPNGKYYIEPYCGIVLIKCTNENIEVDRLKGNGYKVQDATYSPDGKFVATAVDDGFVRIWNTQLKKTIKEYELPSIVWNVEYNHKGNYLAAHSNETIYVLDLNTNIILHKLKGHENHVNGMSFSLDDSLLVSYAKNEIIIWDTYTGAKLAQIHGAGNVQDVKFSFDRKFIVSTSVDSNLNASNECNTIRIWDVDSGALLESFNNKWKASLSFLTEDNKKIIAIVYGYNNTAIELDFIPLQLLINQTKKRFKDRQLSTEDKKKLYIE